MDSDAFAINHLVVVPKQNPLLAERREASGIVKPDPHNVAQLGRRFSMKAANPSCASVL